MLSMLVYFSNSTTCSVSGCSTTRITALTSCYYIRTEDIHRRLFQLPRLNSLSHALNSHSHPIPIPWLILLPFPWESHGTHGIPVFPIPMHTSTPHQTRQDCLSTAAAATQTRQAATPSRPTAHTQRRCTHENVRLNTL